MSRRTERVASLLQHELGAIFQLELPRTPIVTIVEVKVTVDLGIARVYISTIGTPEEQAAIMAHLQEQNKYIRKLLSQRIRHQFRRIPELEFYEDHLYEHARHIEQLLSQVRKAPVDDAETPLD
uniref:Ribosome-binding factor A n=1 Tax=Chlorobium chlorochromatii (strain CaD3) TaxID=340177 RepID=RBFA_CHLCH|nr:RecName: Full=Ribosome-binding factor A [Chlorobium chlorochromatii CaD3]